MTHHSPNTNGQNGENRYRDRPRLRSLSTPIEPALDAVKHLRPSPDKKRTATEE